MLEIICKSCGDSFTPNSEDLELLENGEIDCITPICDFCFANGESYQDEIGLDCEYFNDYTNG
jgi:heterodisulfide reductase subunit B